MGGQASKGAVRLVHLNAISCVRAQRALEGLRHEVSWKLDAGQRCQGGLTASRGLES